MVIILDLRKIPALPGHTSPVEKQFFLAQGNYSYLSLRENCFHLGLVHPGEHEVLRKSSLASHFRFDSIEYLFVFFVVRNEISISPFRV